MLIYESAGMGRGEIQENRRSIPIMLATVDKLDQKGKSVYFCGSGGNTKEMIKGNWLKIYQGLLAPVESAECTSEKLLKPGGIVPVDVEMYQSSTFFTTGEILRLIVASEETVPSLPFKKIAEDCNHGKHVLHFGGKYDSYLLVPEILTKEK
jgi:predicted acyl esterase